MTPPEKKVNWEKFALGMCELLDAIEISAQDMGEGAIEEMGEVRKLCRGRFELAKECGFEVEFFGPGSAGRA